MNKPAPRDSRVEFIAEILFLWPALFLSGRRNPETFYGLSPRLIECKNRILCPLQSCFSYSLHCRIRKYGTPPEYRRLSARKRRKDSTWPPALSRQRLWQTSAQHLPMDL